MHVGAQRLQALLVAHAEAVLLIDDEESQILEARVRVQQAMRGDDDVDLALLEAFEHRLRLLGIAEARQRLDAHRPVGEAVAEVGQMLLHQQRRGRQHRHLLARLRGDERGAHRDLGLAEADIAADDAVHRAARWPDRSSTWRIACAWSSVSSNGKALANAWYSSSGSGRCEARLRLAARVQVEQLRGHVADLLGGAPARPRPLVGAELVQRRVLGRCPGVAAHQVQRCTGT